MPRLSSKPSALNAAQREAVEHGEGPLLVLAGAGSGKTRVIVHRIARLIERGVPERAIVALTFTNKAAQEMRERVDRLADSASRAGSRAGSRAKGKRRADADAGLTVCTFHAFGLAVLSREREAVGRFTVFDQGDQIALVKQLLRAAGDERKYDAQAVLARISNAKNAFLAPGDLRPRSGDEYDEIASVVFPRYQAALRQYRAFDFDDLVCEVARVWSARPDLLARWQERFRYVLVDEYQDTNRAQLEMLRSLCAPRANVCAVGDDDQAIYGWRGADVRNILDFESHFAGARIVKLEQNYRSRAPILHVANAVIAKRTDTKWRKVLFTDRPGGAPVSLAVAPTPDAEATWVAREIRRLIRDENTSPSHIAVLYRSNTQSRLIEAALREQGIAHRVVGGMQFFERKEVKDVLAYLKLALHVSDEITLRRLINYPARGIGEAAVERLSLAALEHGWSLWEAVEREGGVDGLASSARDGCRALEHLVREARRDLFAAKRPPSEVIRAIVERVSLKAAIERESPSADAATKRWANVEGVLATLARREAREGPGLDGLMGFIQLLTLDLSSDSADEETQRLVLLSTLHGSKGLEFDVVFLIGCEEGYLPHARTIDTRAIDGVPETSAASGAQDIEEERRLFYVGVTRARERLVISRAKSRVLRGKSVPRTPSRFLLDVPAELYEEQEVKAEAAMSVQETAAHAQAILAMLKGAE
jgi:DNA helicase-2/ATP-dependent DNA helicase PcrA